MHSKDCPLISCFIDAAANWRRCRRIQASWPGALVYFLSVNLILVTLDNTVFNICCQFRKIELDDPLIDRAGCFKSNWKNPLVMLQQDSLLYCIYWNLLHSFLRSLVADGIDYFEQIAVSLTVSYSTHSEQYCFCLLNFVRQWTCHFSAMFCANGRQNLYLN